MVFATRLPENGLRNSRTHFLTAQLDQVLPDQPDDSVVLGDAGLIRARQRIGAGQFPFVLDDPGRRLAGLDECIQTLPGFGLWPKLS